MTTKYVLFYQPADDILSRAPEHFGAHSARIAEFHERGELLAVGTFGDPERDGSMSIFPSRAAAEAFVSGDPFVLNGLVKSHEIREWDDVLS